MPPPAAAGSAASERPGVRGNETSIRGEPELGNRDCGHASLLGSALEQRKGPAPKPPANHPASQPVPRSDSRDGASRSQSALHMHVLVCICSNVRQFQEIIDMIQMCYHTNHCACCDGGAAGAGCIIRAT